MKQWKVCVTAIIGLGLLTACQSNESGSESAAEEDEPQTFVYKATNGDIEIPSDVENIVLLADSYFGYFETLGVRPIAATQQVFDSSILAEYTDGVENLEDGTSIERILELDPDLIITWAGMENEEQLEQIAPTIAIQYGEFTYKEQLQEFGKMLGEEDKADTWIAEWEEQVEEVRTEINDAVGDQTVSIVQPFAKEIHAFGDSFGRGGEVIYNELELKAPDVVQKEAIDSGIGYVTVSLEALPDVAGDYIFTAPWMEGEGDDMYDSSIWKDLPAVSEGRVFEFDATDYYFNDPITIERQLDFYKETLTSQ